MVESLDEGEFREKLVTFAQVLSEDKELLQWFEGLKWIPKNLRQGELGAMVRRMEEEGEERELIAIVKLLMDQDVYEGLYETLKKYKENKISP